MSGTELVQLTDVINSHGMLAMNSAALVAGYADALCELWLVIWFWLVWY